MRKFICLVIILVALFANVAPALACEPPPTNPPSDNTYDCRDLGYGYSLGFRVTGARNGKYFFTSQYGSLVGGAPSDRNNYVEISGSDLKTFDWNASMGIDAVIVQANGKSKSTKLNEATSGENFHGVRGGYGKLYKVEKVYFCYDYELSISVEAEGSATGGPAAWNITKSVAVPEKSAFAGEKAVFDYTVAVQKTAGGDSSYSVKTVVTIKNNTPLKAKLKSGKVFLSPGNIDLTSSLQCEDASFATKYLYPGQAVTCTTTKALESQLEGSVTAKVSTYTYYGYFVGGASAAADIEWSGEIQPGSGEGGFEAVNVTDTNEAFGGPFVVSDSQSWTYPVELACPTDPAAYVGGEYTLTLDNTATIVQTNQSASQSVTLKCYAPTVSTGASAAYDVQYVWGITKTSPLTSLDLEEGESASVDYLATVSVTSTNQTNVRLAGSVTIGNPRPDAELSVTLVDEMAPGVPAPFADCTSPVTVPAAGSVTCSFETATETLPEGASNNVQVVFNGITFAATAPFGAQVNEIDECVTVTDSAFEEPLGTVCANQAPVEFPYSVTVGPYDQCRKTSYLNAADFVTNDTGASDYSTHELLITIHCPLVSDCVRPIGYWLAHSNKSDPLTYHPTWDMVTPDGPSTPFYTTGSSWVQVLGANAGSSTYLRLAQAYIAARLNTYWGALPNDTVAANITQADALLAQYAASQNLVTGTVVTEFRNATTVLSNFNRGVLGSPVCTDCND